MNQTKTSTEKRNTEKAGARVRGGVLALACAAVALGAYACGSDDDPPASSATPDGGGQTDTDAASDDSATPSDAPANGEADTAQPPPLPCTEAELAATDFRPDGGAGDGGDPTVAFPMVMDPSQYTNRCLTIQVGQTVTFEGSFENHPLEAFAGTTPSPIPTLTSTTPGAGALTVTFDDEGTFGYRCQFHPFQMNGAVKVVP